MNLRITTELQANIDRLVDAFHAGRTDDAQGDLLAIVDRAFMREQPGRERVDHQYSAIPLREWAWYHDDLDVRVGLGRGAHEPVTDAMRLEFIQEMWEDSEEEHSVGLIPLRSHASGRRALLVYTTTDPRHNGGISVEVHGLFRSLGEFEASLRSQGWIFRSEIWGLAPADVKHYWHEPPQAEKGSPDPQAGRQAEPWRSGAHGGWRSPSATAGAIAGDDE